MGKNDKKQAHQNKLWLTYWTTKEDLWNPGTKSKSPTREKN